MQRARDWALNFPKVDQAESASFLFSLYEKFLNSLTSASGECVYFSLNDWQQQHHSKLENEKLWF